LHLANLIGVGRMESRIRVSRTSSVFSDCDPGSLPTIAPTTSAVAQRDQLKQRTMNDQETESTTYGLKGVQHHLDGLRVDLISKQVKIIGKAVIERHDGEFDFFDFVNCLEAYIRAEFDEPEPRSLALWFAKQYEHFKVRGYDVTTGTLVPPRGKRRSKKTAVT
jgi:hypothetical protein